MSHLRLVRGEDDYSEGSEPERIKIGRSQLFLATCLAGALLPSLGALLVVGWALLQVGAFLVSRVP